MPQAETPPSHISCQVDRMDKFNGHELVLVSVLDDRILPKLQEVRIDILISIIFEALAVYLQGGRVSKKTMPEVTNLLN